MKAKSRVYEGSLSNYMAQLRAGERQMAKLEEELTAAGYRRVGPDEFIKEEEKK